MVNLLSFAMAIASYVLTGLGLYTIAKRRGINKPWLAWIPVANIWLLGCISDQYRHVARGQVKNKRKTMLVLMIVSLVLTTVMIGVVVSLVLDVLPYLPKELMSISQWQKMSTMSQTELETYLLDTLESIDITVPSGLESTVLVKAAVVSILAIGALVASIWLGVLELMAYYDLFAAADPRSATMFFVLSLVGNMMGLSILLPVFIFISREKDLGMPPRGGQIIDAAGEWIPPQQM